VKVHIVSADGICDNAVIALEDGTRLAHVMALDLVLRPKELVKAQVTFSLPRVDVVGEVTVSEEHLRELAAAHGYDLKRRSD